MSSWLTSLLRGSEPPRGGVTPPVFVGGTGRSGTTIAATMVGQSAKFELVPVEVRFHADQFGLADVIDGAVDIDRFEAEMEGRWYHRSPVKGRQRGLHVISSWIDFQVSMGRFRRHAERDRVAAAGQLVHDLLDPVASRAGKPSWVEMTPPAIKVADRLAEAMPTARFLHMVRDGRDVAASVVRRNWGSMDMPSAIEWWADAMIVASHAISRVPADRVLELRIESLVGPEREDVFRRLCGFLGTENDPGMRRFFEDEVTASMVHMGRWRQGRDDAEIVQLGELYEKALARIDGEGGWLAPV